MIYKTYIEKFNTIISGSKLNTGINPISEIVYGKDFIVSRAMIWFDHNKVKELMCNGTMVDREKMTHRLKMTNAGSVDFTQLHERCQSTINGNTKQRAVSFDLVFFLIPKPWDRGKGFDYTANSMNMGFYSQTPKDPKRLYSTAGCNWFNRMSGLPWDEEGIFTNDTLSVEYDKFANGEESIVIGRQHFDVGNESIDFDITDVFNKFIDGELENNGIGIAFSPMLELTEDEYENYISFFTDKTNTFFEPYVETRYDDYVSDDRSYFSLGKNNKLYLYCTIGEHLDDLDSNPLVTVTDQNGDVVTDSNGKLLSSVESKRYAKGIYYIELKMSKGQFETGVMFYDTWSGISYQGEPIDDIELDFVTKASNTYFKIGNSIRNADVTFSPSISGILHKEQILRGDVRRLVINARPSYTTNTTQLVDSMDIRLYVRDGLREIDVISWDKINKTSTDNYYLVDTNILLPQRYFVDIRVRYGMNTVVHHDVLSFDIVSDITNKYA